MAQELVARRWGICGGIRPFTHSQAIHLDAPELDDLPTGHDVQFTSPSTSFEYLPPVHVSHTAAAVSDRLPLSHAVQLEAPLPENRPATHEAQEAEAWPE